MLFDIKCKVDGKDVIAQVTAEEISRAHNELFWAELREKVEKFMSEHYPDARELYGETYDGIIGVITRDVKAFSCVDRLSVDEIEDNDIDETFCEKYMSFAEIRHNYYDDIQKCTTIDAWKTGDDNEEGIVVARVFEDRVEFTNPLYSEYLNVLRAVKEVRDNA